MKKKRQLHTEEIVRLLGLPSRALAERCPDLRTTYPSSPCRNLGCPWAVREAQYMNCSFLASEAGEHTLEAIGSMMGITRERARQIEKIGLHKLRLLKRFTNGDATVHQPSLAAGPSVDASLDEGSESADEFDHVSAFDDRKLA